MNCIAITLSIVITLILLWIWYRIRNRELFKMIAGMNDLKALPLIGLGHHFIGKSKKDYFKILFDLIMNDNNVRTPIKLWVCSKLCIMVDNLEDIHKILTSPDCYEKGSSYDQVPFPNGLITSKPKVWLEHRKLLNPTFHIKLLKRYINNFNEISRRIVLDLEPICSKGGFNMSQIIGNHVVDVQMRTLFGSVESSSVISRIHNNVLSINQYLGEFALQLNFHPIISSLHKLFYLLMENGIISKLKENYDLVKKTLAAKIEGLSTDADAPQNFIKCIATLCNDGRFGESDVQDHINTILLAGIDTTIATLNNIFMLLAMNPAIQEKCYRELVENMGTHFHDIEIDQLNKLEYLNRTLKECLRLIPTIPVIQRKSSVDLPIYGGTIPKGVDIVIPILKIHHSHKYWGDQPTLFNPDHFLEENISKRPTVSYIPYSYGNRNCIGSKYAQWLMRIVMAHLISKFKFTTKLKFNELKFVFGITLAIEHDQLIEVEKR